MMLEAEDGTMFPKDKQSLYQGCKDIAEYRKVFGSIIRDSEISLRQWCNRKRRDCSTVWIGGELLWDTSSITEEAFNTFKSNKDKPDKFIVLLNGEEVRYCQSDPHLGLDVDQEDGIFGRGDRTLVSPRQYRNRETTGTSKKYDVWYTGEYKNDCQERPANTLTTLSFYDEGEVRNLIGKITYNKNLLTATEIYDILGSGENIDKVEGVLEVTWTTNYNNKG